MEDENWDDQPGERRFAKIGCGIILLGLLALLSWCNSPQRWIDQLPSAIAVDEVLDGDDQRGIPSGCFKVVYRLSQSTIDHLNRDGIRYLSTGTRGDENPRNRFGPWRETPRDIDLETNGHGSNTIFGLYAMGGCSGKSSGKRYEGNLPAALEAPGSYYTVTSNREGIIIVAPRERLAAYFYFG
jgi:hypothetical protein